MALEAGLPLHRITMSTHGNGVHPFFADLVLLDGRLAIRDVLARGRLVVERGEPVVRGWFEGKGHAALPRGERP